MEKTLSNSDRIIQKKEWENMKDLNNVNKVPKSPKDEIKEAIVDLAKKISWTRGNAGTINTEHMVISAIEYLTELLLLGRNHELRIQQLTADLEALRRAVNKESDKKPAVKAVE